MLNRCGRRYGEGDGIWGVGLRTGQLTCSDLCGVRCGGDGGERGAAPAGFSEHELVMLTAMLTTLGPAEKYELFFMACTAGEPRDATRAELGGAHRGGRSSRAASTRANGWDRRCGRPRIMAVV